MAKVKLPIELRTNLVAGPWGTGDLLYDDVVILLPFNGEDGDSETRDEKGSNVTITSPGELDSAQARWGNTSYLCDGPLQFSTQPLIDAGMTTGDWTVELWYRPDGTASANDRIFQTRDGDFVTGIYLAHATSSTNIEFGLEFDPSKGVGWDFLGANITVTSNVWQHIALVRNGDTFTLYLDGTSVDSTTTSGVLNINAAYDCVIGAQSSGRANSGWIDDVRITASARYTKDFVPQRVPYRNYKNRIKLPVISIPAFVELSVFDAVDTSLAADNLTVTTLISDWAACWADEGKSTGKWYFEATWVSGGVNFNFNVGVDNTKEITTGIWIGETATGWGYLGDGYKGHSGFSNISNPISIGETAMCLVDLDAGVITIIVEGTTTEMYTGQTFGTVSPGVAGNGRAPGSCVIKANFGQEAFVNTPIVGYEPWSIS